MTAGTTARFADMLSAMGTEPRLRIVRLLLSAHPRGPGGRRDCSASCDIPNSTLSHHLDKLKNEELVKVRREGTFLWYSAEHGALQELLQVPVCRVLHPQPGGRAAEDRLLQLKVWRRA